MGSRILRRSGNAVVEYCDNIAWAPEYIIIVGVGVQHEEAYVMREVWPDVPILGIEPNPRTIETIQKTYTSAPLNATLIHAAVTDFQGEAPIYSRHNWKNGATLIEPTDLTGLIVEQVPCRTLDELVPPEARNILLWFDCEGSEIKALSKALRTIERTMLINIEMTGRPRHPGWPSPIHVHWLLQAYGFLQAWTHTHRTCISQFDAIYAKPGIFKPEMCSVMSSIEEYLRIGTVSQQI